MREQTFVPDRDVRRLLRCLRRPKSLESVSLAVAIREQLGGRTCYEAVIAFLERTFAQYGAEGLRYFDLIRRSDLSRNRMKAAAIADDLNLSARQYYRYRARAVSIIVRAVTELFTKIRASRPFEALAQSVDLLDPTGALQIYELQDTNRAPRSSEEQRLHAQLCERLETHGMHDAAEEIAQRLREQIRFRNCEHRPDVLFGLAHRDFVLARFHCAADDVERALRVLRSNVGVGRRSDVVLAICEAEACAHFAEAEPAVEYLRVALALAERLADPPLLATTMLKLAEILSLNGDFDEALRFARAVEVYARSVPSFATPARLVLNRIALATGDIAPYSFNGELQTHDEAMLAATSARALLWQGDAAAAHALARRVRAFAKERRYTAVEISALATLGDLESAWRCGVCTADRLIAFDAFNVPGVAGMSSTGPNIATYAAIGDALRKSSTHFTVDTVALTFAELSHRALCGETLPSRRLDALCATLHSGGVTGSVLRRTTHMTIGTLASFAAGLHPNPQRKSALVHYKSAMNSLIDGLATQLSRYETSESERRVC